MVKQGVYVADRRRGNGPLAAADGINEQRTSRRLRFRAESRCVANFFAACVRHIQKKRVSVTSFTKYTLRNVLFSAFD